LRSRESQRFSTRPFATARICGKRILREVPVVSLNVVPQAVIIHLFFEADELLFDGGIARCRLPKLIETYRRMGKAKTTHAEPLRIIETSFRPFHIGRALHH
jgi:hypothetical protein